MSLFTRLFTNSLVKEEKTPNIQRSMSRNESFLRGDDEETLIKSSSGSITIPQSLTLTTIYACVRILSETIASLPLPVYRKLKSGGKVRAREHSLYTLIHDKPNPFQTAFQWRSLMLTHKLLWGAGISEIEFNKNGYPIALWPLPPWKVTPMRSDSGQYFYRVKLDQGSYKDLIPEQVVVFPMLSTSSFQWMSPIMLHRETIEGALAVNQFGNDMFEEGTNPAGFVSYPGKINETSEKSLKKRFKCYSGLGGSHRLMLLDQGMEFKRIPLPPQDVQYIETRKFNVSEMARIFNVPMYMLQEHEKQTSWGSGIEEQFQAFVTVSLTPHISQMEQEINDKVIYTKSLECEFVLEGLLRGKLSDRVEAYTKLWNMGAISANEIRQKENLNPIDDGDIYFVPLNMQNAKFAKDNNNDDSQDNNNDNNNNDDQEG